MNHSEDNSNWTPFDGAAPDGSNKDDRFYAVHDCSSDRSLCSGVVDAVAAVTGESPTQLPPLHDSIDTDALENLVYGFNTRPNSDGSEVSVSFQFAGTHVTACSDGTIVVEVIENT